MKSWLTSLLYACALILGASDACAAVTPLTLPKVWDAAAAKWQISYVESQYVVENLGRMQAENTPENHYLRHGSNGWAAYSATYGAAPEFYAYVVPSSLTTPAAPAEDGVEKVLIDSHLYIRHRDRLYDVTGRVR